MPAIKILIVEDNVEVLETLVEIAHVLGHEVHGCTSSAEAELMLKAHQFNLLLTDHNLSGVSGWELAIQSGKIEGLRTVVMSGSSEPENLPLYIEWLRKPFDFNAFEKLCVEVEEELTHRR